MNLSPLEASRFLHVYGPAYRRGVVVDHVNTVAALPGVRIIEGDLATWVVDDLNDGLASPVLCGDIVEIRTEDGITDGRCGLLATRDGACEGHAWERDEYAAMSEAERAYRERETILQVRGDAR